MKKNKNSKIMVQDIKEVAFILILKATEQGVII
jgi:hypothetical protein